MTIICLLKVLPVLNSHLVPSNSDGQAQIPSTQVPPLRQKKLLAQAIKQNQ